MNPSSTARHVAADGDPVGGELSRQPYYSWRAADPITGAELAEACRANPLFEAHRKGPDFGYRHLVEETSDAGVSVADRTAWRNCTNNRWWSVFGRKRAKKRQARTAGARRPHRT